MQAAEVTAQEAEKALLRGEEVCGTLLFKDLCRQLTKIEKLRTCKEKMSLLFNKGLYELLSQHPVKQSVFPLLRLILPLNDGTRKKYGLKQAAVATTYIDALHLNPTSADAQRLKFWKNPSKLSSALAKKTSGELGEVLEDVLRTRISVENSPCTLHDVNNILDDLAATSGDKQTSIIRTKILNVFSPLEQKWLMRIVFQDMKIGLKYENVLGKLNPNALQRYNECTDLRQMCSDLANGCLTASNENDGVVLSRGISLFTCFQPMLAKGFSNTGQINEVENAMKKHPFVMDLKLDGERMLCHVSNRADEGGKGMFWSRNGNDYSATYRALLDDVIANVQCDACVLDGEVCAWDDCTRRFIPFGHNRTVARYEQESQRENPGGSTDKNSNSSGMRLVYVLFDILYLEGLRDATGKILRRDQWRNYIDYDKTIPGGILALQAEESKEACRSAHARISTSSSPGDILHMPLIARRALLSQAVLFLPNRIQSVRSTSVFTSSVADRKRQIEIFFNQVSNEGEEGLVVKDLLSPYALGMKSRQLMHWVKMKPEYSDMTRDLDLIILGAYYGEGKSMRGQGLSTFLCGVKDSSSEVKTSDSSTADNISPIYKSICKVGTGYSFSELEEIRERLSSIAQPWDKSNRQYLPPHFCPWRIGKQEDIPDVWIPPEHSIIVELKCAELVTSTQFSAGITCRFPRLRKIRYDKEVDEVMTIEDVKEILERPRMNFAEAANRGVTENKRKKKRSMNSSSGAQSGRLFRHSDNIVASQFLIPKHTEKNLVMDSVMFQGKVFCVIEGSYTLQQSDFVKSGHESPLLKYATKKNQYKLTRLQVIEVVQRNGGDVVANPLPNCFVIVGDKRTMQIKSLIDAGKNDVLSFQYIVDSINGNIANEEKNPDPSHFLGYTPETRSLFSGMFDEFGDSFTEDITEAQVNAIFSRMDDVICSLDRKRQGSLKVKRAKKTKKCNENEPDSETSNSLIDETLGLTKNLKSLDWRGILRSEVLEDDDYAPMLDSNEWNIFWRSNVVLYLDIYEDVDCRSDSSYAGLGNETFIKMICNKDEQFDLFSSNITMPQSSRNLKSQSTRLKAVVADLLLRGAKISPFLNEEVTHLVVDFDNNYSPAKERALQIRLRDLRLRPSYCFEKRVVNKKWIDDCISQNMILVPTEKHLVQWKVNAESFDDNNVM